MTRLFSTRKQVVLSPAVSREAKQKLERLKPGRWRAILLALLGIAQVTVVVSGIVTSSQRQWWSVALVATIAGFGALAAVPTIWWRAKIRSLEHNMQAVWVRPGPTLTFYKQQCARITANVDTLHHTRLQASLFSALRDILQLELNISEFEGSGGGGVRQVRLDEAIYAKNEVVRKITALIDKYDRNVA